MQMMQCELMSTDRWHVTRGDRVSGTQHGHRTLRTSHEIPWWFYVSLHDVSQNSEQKIIRDGNNWLITNGSCSILMCWYTTQLASIGLSGQAQTRDCNGISDLSLIQLILPNWINCIWVSSEIPLLSLAQVPNTLGLWRQHLHNLIKHSNTISTFPASVKSTNKHNLNICDRLWSISESFCSRTLTFFLERADLLLAWWCFYLLVLLFTCHFASNIFSESQKPRILLKTKWLLTSEVRCGDDLSDGIIFNI